MCICLAAAGCCMGVIRGLVVVGLLLEQQYFVAISHEGSLSFLVSGCCFVPFSLCAVGIIGCGCVSGDPGRAPQRPGLCSPAC